MKKSPIDAVDLLTTDHADVKKLFAQYEGLSDRSRATKKKIADQICHALTVHAALEEQLFYPAVRKATGDDDMVDEAEVEHGSAKDLIAQISQSDPDEHLFDARISVLSELIAHHVEEEENDMFKKARTANLDLPMLREQMLQLKDALEKNQVSA